MVYFPRAGQKRLISWLRWLLGCCFSGISNPAFVTSGAAAKWFDVLTSCIYWQLIYQPLLVNSWLCKQLPGARSCTLLFVDLSHVTLTAQKQRETVCGVFYFLTVFKLYASSVSYYLYWEGLLYVANQKVLI